jgi:hypothetical protein
MRGLRDEREAILRPCAGVAKAIPLPFSGEIPANVECGKSQQLAIYSCSERSIRGVVEGKNAALPRPDWHRTGGMRGRLIPRTSQNSYSTHLGE